MNNEQLITLTADIVSSHVANNNVAVGDVANLVQQVHAALARLGESEAASEPAAKKPMVSIRSSIKPDYIVCMECGIKQKMLKRHLSTSHKMTPEQYRSDYGLPRDYPMTAPAYSERRRSLAQTIGLGRTREEPSKRSRTRQPKAETIPES
jgi:predicted transcriptional regulator